MVRGCLHETAHYIMSRTSDALEGVHMRSGKSASCKNVPQRWAQACTAGVTSGYLQIYVQGEDQKKLDVLADNVFVNVLTRCGQCAVLVPPQPPLLPY